MYLFRTPPSKFLQKAVSIKKQCRGVVPYYFVFFILASPLLRRQVRFFANITPSVLFKRNLGVLPLTIFNFIIFFFWGGGFVSRQVGFFANIIPSVSFQKFVFFSIERGDIL